MESTPILSQGAAGDRSHPDSDRGTSSNLPLDSRLHYREPYLLPVKGYRGPLENLDIEEARALFGELLCMFQTDHDAFAPLPPTGLPGIAANPLSRYSDEFRLIAVGLSYFGAIVRNEGRAMHHRWEEASEILRNRPPPPPEPSRRPFRDRDRPEQRVYFIGAESGPIKIGVAADPKARLATLQTGHHERLEILATCAGGLAREGWYHGQFHDHRLNGEWFARAPEIEAEILMLAKGE